MFSVSVCDPVIESGAAALEYADITSVDVASYEVARYVANQQADLVADWMPMPLTPNTGRWSEDQNSSPQGATYKISINFDLTDNSGPTRDELDQMRHRRYLVRLRPRGAAAWLLIGTLEQPLEVTARFDSGTTGSGDAAKHTIAFEGTALRKSPTFTPTF